MSVLAQCMAASTSGVTNPRQWLVDWVRGGSKSSAGIAVTPMGAMALSAYYACIRNISEDVGKIPLKVYEKLKPRGKKPREDHSLYPVLHDAPNPHMGSMTFREMMTGWMMGWGNAYAEIARAPDDSRLELFPIHPSRADVKWSEGRQKVYEVTNDNGSIVRFREDQIFHLRGLGDELKGYSVARLGSESIGRALAVQQFSASFFGEGTTAAGVFTTPAPLDEEAFKHLKATWPKGLPNAHHPLFLEEGMTWQSMTVPPEEAQMLETGKDGVIDVCRWHRMQPHKVQALDHATFSNIEHQDIEYVGDTLFSHYKRWEEEIKRKLISPNEPEIFAEHLITGLLRGDQAARSTYYRERFNIGTLSQNDIRDLENENGIGPEGDKYYVPMNLTSGDDEEEEPEPAAPIPPMIPREAEVTESMRPVFLETAARVVRKESMALTRAAKRYQTLAAFSEWADKFYTEHRGLVAEAFFPLARTVWGLLGIRVLGPTIAIEISRPTDKVQDLLTSRANNWCDYACSLVKSSYEANDLHDVLGSWETEETDSMANELLLELVAAARDYHGTENLN